MISSTERERFLRIAAVGCWARAIASRFRRSARLKGVTRAEFEQMARDFDLSYPELYGLLTGCVVSPDLLEQHLAKLERSPERTRPPGTEHLLVETQSCLPIGPFCC